MTSRNVLTCHSECFANPGLPRPALIALVLLINACGGGTGSGTGPQQSSAPPVCTNLCSAASESLSSADTGQIIAQAVAEGQARGQVATIAVVDRVGNVLGVFRMSGAQTTVTISSTPPGNPVDGGLEDIFIIPDTMAAISKAISGAYLSSEGNAFTTRTAGQIVQDHFNPLEFMQPGGPLFGVQFSQLPCSDLSQQFPGAGTVGPKRSPLGLAADPGGFPLYESGEVVGGVGVIADGRYGLDKNVADGPDADLDEQIALAATFGFAAPVDRRGDRITVDGRTLRFSDANTTSLVSVPANASSFASINGVAGNLVAVPGYYAGVGLVTGTVFETAASGIRADALDYAGLDAFVLVDAADNERYRPQAGTDGAPALTAVEVTAILRQALAVANRARAQIRRPLGSQARVSIAVTDTNGVVLGIVRSRDAPVFGVDVALQKARTASFFSSAAAAASLGAVPAAEYLDGDTTPLRTEPIGQYVTAVRNFLGMPTALADGAVAFSDRAGGNLSRPYYPDGIDGNPAGPFSKPSGEWSPFSTGLQLDISYNAIIQHVAFVSGAILADVGTNCTGVGGISNGFAVSNPILALANGTQIFPGSVPIYRGTTLVGGIGVSGDGVDQDDMIAFLGVDEAALQVGSINNAPLSIRADTIVAMGNRLRFVNCPQSPFLDSNEQNVCSGK